jgi:hypothetical protein
MTGRQTAAAEKPHDPTREMMDEARQLVDVARRQGVTLRLIGGFAVLEHCRSAEFCERDHSDLDMVAPSRQVRELGALMGQLGFVENVEVRIATQNTQLQFARPCIHGGPGRPPTHADDHVDIFLDTFRMDHDVALGDRLEIERYTVTVSDLLLTKLQVFKLNEKDLRDIVALFKDHRFGDADEPGAVNGAYLARLCADDWGLFYDVATNLQRVSERLSTFGLSAVEEEDARRNVARLIGALDAAPKSLRWRLRARVGTRASWHREVEDQG